MYNLLVFIRKYSATIVFVLLELLCLIMVIQSLPYHNRKMAGVANSISGSIHTTTSNWADYMSLKSENEQLARQNALLLSRLTDVNSEYDTLITNDLYTYMPAHVINNSLDRYNNYILIDKGRADGVEPDMGVICDQGVVGKVINVTTNFASVMSVLNSYSVISGRFKDNQYVANVVWDNVNYQYGQVRDIPSHLIIEKGDTLVTSGFSNSFPPEIPVGTIESTDNDDNDAFITAKLKFTTNFSTLRHVYVVKNNFQTEIDSLCIQN